MEALQSVRDLTQQSIEACVELPVIHRRPSHSLWLNGLELTSLRNIE